MDNLQDPLTGEVIELRGIPYGTLWTPTASRVLTDEEAHNVAERIIEPSVEQMKAKIALMKARLGR